jgi:metallo-beta-lactamase family protein
LRERNWEPFSVPPNTIDYVVITHGHLDHCGYLPRLVKEGFQGTIFCSEPTELIVELILRDSAKIQMEEAQRATEEGYSKHEKPEPLYDLDDVEKVLPLIKVVPTDVYVKLSEEIHAKFSPSGHIIGACSVMLYVQDKKLLFSGDLGTDNDVLMYPPQMPEAGDYVFLESTYGNRNHPESDPESDLCDLVNEVFNRGGSVIIPSFAVERVQTLMYLLWQLRKKNRIPKMPCIIDTPMGIQVLEVFRRFPNWHKLSKNEYEDMCKHFTQVENFKDTMEWAYDTRPKVIIAASGMITGGRVLTYLQKMVHDAKHAVLLVGYQAEATRGRKLLEGATELKIYGKYIPVGAQIASIDRLSAHADQSALLGWIQKLATKPQMIFLIHGEVNAAETLRTKLKDSGYNVCVPYYNQVVKL